MSNSLMGNSTAKWISMYTRSPTYEAPLAIVGLEDGVAPIQ